MCNGYISTLTEIYKNKDIRIDFVSPFSHLFDLTREGVISKLYADFLNGTRDQRKNADRLKKIAEITLQQLYTFPASSYPDLVQLPQTDVIEEEHRKCQSDFAQGIYERVTAEQMSGDNLLRQAWTDIGAINGPMEGQDPLVDMVNVDSVLFLSNIVLMHRWASLAPDEERCSLVLAPLMEAPVMDLYSKAYKRAQKEGKMAELLHLHTLEPLIPTLGGAANDHRPFYVSGDSKLYEELMKHRLEIIKQHGPSFIEGKPLPSFAEFADRPMPQQSLLQRLLGR